MCKSKIYYVFLFFGLLPFQLPVYGYSKAEIHYLQQVQQVITAVYPLLTEAQKHQDPSANLQFQYADLISDINTIESGISQALQKDRWHIQSIPVLHQHYSTHPNWKGKS